MARYYLFNGSYDHLMNGIENGFVQQRYKNRFNNVIKGDYVVFYATRLNYHTKVPYRKFIGIGRISDDQIIEVPHGANMYYRMMVNFKKYKERDLKSIIRKLSFIKNKKYYGMYFIRGKREITKEDYDVIAAR